MKKSLSGGLPAYDREADRMRTLLTMTTCDAHRVIMGKSLAASFFIGSSSFVLVINKTTISRKSSNFGQIDFRLQNKYGPCVS